MKPYYQHAGITIYHGDCREVLPSLQAESIDLIVTDPPYGVRWKSCFRRLEFDHIVGDEDTEAAVEGVRMALSALRPHRHVYVFGRYDFSHTGLQDTVELIWDKGIQGSGNVSLPWGVEHEYIQFGVYIPSGWNRKDGRGRLSARLRKGSVLNVPRLNATAVKSHPTEKPVLLLRQLIESSSCIGETVLDPFMGVGSTLKAAEIEGRNAIGIEIDERYCELAVKRLGQEVLPFEIPTGTTMGPPEEVSNA